MQLLLCLLKCYWKTSAPRPPSGSPAPTSPRGEATPRRLHTAPANNVRAHEEPSEPKAVDHLREPASFRLTSIVHER